ncbi:major facilitator superfamily transporter [Pseudomonas putida]|uniref:MFS transporter n=1 Tax=Pseudomonas guariconensis TaxID=1288410 RepID=UPI0018D949DE|nr:MFS transporter [Pseudomonas guariconensis]CAB5525028.1 major facilitator superfamily transporter [Pseudomonas putida]MBH3359418.1 MFS transporter [Pseudomonas guariconensis]CAB5531352.1 major facilitator superfamily transporter [Pseudomonas putida]CAB5575405.1 major facilitator superfamily transporter [Pseudomonas putida]CAB5576748.1 major facilitator superfamily transporter [Pseudomonas putida]
MPDSPRPLAVTLQVVSIVLFTFIGYLNIGIPLAVLPSYVHNDLGFSAIVAGLVISVQYLATLLSRPHAGRIIDNLGSKKAVMYGLLGCGLSGVLMLASSFFTHLPWLSLACLLIGRLVLGSAESLVGSGAIGWGIGRVGAEHTAKVISWNGIASYGALAVGAPLGVLMVKSLGLWSMGVSIILLGIIGLLLAWPKRAAPIVAGVRLPFLRVLGKVFPHGSGLALGSIGFGTIATFITLYYASRDWNNAALCLSVFGACFIGARLLFGHLINRIGGFRVAIACLAVEALGLLMLWQATSAELALAGAALSGFGFSLVFPALGVEAVNQVSAANRGAAVGAYSLFIDLSLGITGPLVGAVASGFGFASIFLFAAGAAACGLVLSLYLYRQARRPRQHADET